MTLERAESLLRGLGDVRVLVVGDLMLDQYITGSVERISPEAPVPVVRVEGESSAVGGAANVAANVVSLGAQCTVAGCVGTDLLGRALREALEARGISTTGVVETDTRPTTVKTRVMARHQQVVRFDREEDGDVPDAVAEDLEEAIGELAGDVQVLVMEDYNKGVLTPRVIEAVLEAAKARDLPTVVDPKRLRFFHYGGATLFKPNAKELAEALTDTLHPDDRDWMTRTRDRLSCRNLLLTLGEHGMSLLTETGEHVRVPAVARDVYDVSGAGDTVTAVLSVALAAGADPTEAAILANHAAAVEVGKSGVATVSPQEILDHVRVVGA